MKYLTLIILTLVVGMVSCTRSTDHKQILAEAERIAYTLPDSALALVNVIEPSDLKEDSLRALYHLVTASAHKAKESSMVSDSLIRFSFEYYRDRDNNRFLQSGDLYALYLFWVGDGKRALGLLDSIVALPDIPQRLMIQLLQSRIGIGGAEFDSKNNLRYIKRLLELDNDSANQIEYTYQLCENYQYAGHGDSALIIIDRLIDHARMNHLGNEHFKYTYEKIGILEEIGRYDESNAQVDYILQIGRASCRDRVSSPV